MASALAESLDLLGFRWDDLLVGHGVERLVVDVDLGAVYGLPLSELGFIMVLLLGRNHRLED